MLRFDSLEWLRGIAAVLIVLVHAGNEYHQLADSVNPIPHNFVLGVDVFFVLSGFLMFYTTRSNSGGVKEGLVFFIKRCARIFPAYWFFSMLAVLALLAFSSQMTNAGFSLEHVVKSFLFIPAYYPGLDSIQPVLRVGWSLNFEMYFYLLFSICLTVGRFRVWLLAVLLFSFPFLFEGVFHEFYSSSLVVEFLIGGVLCNLYLKYTSFFNVKFGLVVAVLAVSFYQFFVGETDVSNLEYRGISFGAVAVLIVASVLCIPVHRPKSILWQAGRLLGASSYVLYLSHMFVLVTVSIIFSKIGLDSALLYFAVCLFASITFSILFYVLIEKPVLKAISIRLADFFVKKEG